MIDASRWVLVEAWLALGLRVEWAPSYERLPDSAIQTDDDGSRFYYDGHGTWKVIEHDRARQLRTAPTLTAETMAHELAHYLVATEPAREARNFGLGMELRSDEEYHALAAEKVISAVIAACSRIAELALKGGR